MAAAAPFAALTLSVVLVAELASGCTSSSRPTPRAVGARTVVTGPITGHVTEPLSATAASLPNGYVEQEFFVSGRATSYDAPSRPADGRWTVTPAGAAPYRTRVIVRRPTDPSRFNGVVVVEWLNVSAGESSPDWSYLNPELTDDGYAYVGVSAQALAVQGGMTMMGTRAVGLVASDPSRYRSLHHPGDRYAYDIVAQVAAAVRSDSGGVLGNLQPTSVVAAGESQSAFFLTTFANAIEPRTHAFDGIFIHSRGGGGAPIDGSLAIRAATAAGQRIRTDLSAPVFMFETETDVARLGYYSARQPDTRRIRTWEVAGTSHADAYLVGGLSDYLRCGHDINDGPQHVVAEAAFAAFARWVTHGVAPPTAPPLALAGRSPVRLARDRLGNARGGVRTPAVDVPVAALSGVGDLKSGALCYLFGSTTPFTRARLDRLYGDRATYVARASRGPCMAGSFARSIGPSYFSRPGRCRSDSQGNQNGGGSSSAVTVGVWSVTGVRVLDPLLSGGAGR